MHNGVVNNNDQGKYRGGVMKYFGKLRVVEGSQEGRQISFEFYFKYACQLRHDRAIGGGVKYFDTFKGGP